MSVKRALVTGITGQDGSHLAGSARKARRALGWEPSVGFHDLVRLMVDHDAELAKREATP